MEASSMIRLACRQLTGILILVSAIALAYVAVDAIESSALQNQGVSYHSRVASPDTQ